METATTTVAFEFISTSDVEWQSETKSSITAKTTSHGCYL